MRMEEFKGGSPEYDINGALVEVTVPDSDTDFLAQFVDRNHIAGDWRDAARTFAPTRRLD
jgi:hypothetical protein